MSFILENGDLSVTSGNRTLFTTTRRNPHIISKITDTITVDNLTVLAFPRAYVTGTAWLFGYFFAGKSGGKIHSINSTINSNSQGKFFILPFFKITSVGSTSTSGAGTMSHGNTSNRWMYSPGGLLVNAYVLNYAFNQNQNDTPTGFFGGLTVNVLLNPPGYDNSLLVYYRNNFAGCGITPSSPENPYFDVPTQYGSIARDLVSQNTNATIEYVIYLGRF